VWVWWLFASRAMSIDVCRSSSGRARARDDDDARARGGRGRVCFIFRVRRVVASSVWDRRTRAGSVRGGIGAVETRARAFVMMPPPMTTRREASRRRRFGRRTRALALGLLFHRLDVGVARGTRAPVWSCASASCASESSSSSAATMKNERGDVVAVGDASCATTGRGVTFTSRGERLVSTSTTNEAIEAVRMGDGAFTLAVAVEPSADAVADDDGVPRPIVTLSTTLNESAWTHWCADDVGGYYMSLWMRDGWLEMKTRAPHPTAPFQCTSTHAMRSDDVPKLARGRMNRVAVTYDPSLGLRLFINGTRAFPPSNWGSEYGVAAGDAASTWTSSSSRVVVGAYGDRSFLGTVYAVDVFDVALSDDELVEDASAHAERPRWMTRPISRDVVVGEDEATNIALAASPADGDGERALRFTVVSLPSRGVMYDASDNARVVSVPHALERPMVRFAPERNAYSIEASDADNARGEYARFHFEVRDADATDGDESGDADAAERGVVRIRVVSANDAPSAPSVRLVAYVGVPERVRLPFEDIDATCPENVASCRGDRATSVRITRAPERGRLYACDDAETMSRVVRDGTNVTSPTDVLCFAYIGDETSARDSFEYVVADKSGAHSDVGTVSIALKSPCTLLRRTHDALEDETSTIGVTAACVGLNASWSVFASAVSSPMHGAITSEVNDVRLRGDTCSDDQNATCEEWGVVASSVSCFCGGFEYVPERNYYNTPNTDVYGDVMVAGPTGATGEEFGQPDIIRMTVRTSNGWMTDPFIAYVNVRNAFDAPRVSIDGDAFAQLERIAANTTSFALSGAIDIDVAPDYDASAMSVTIWSSYAKVLEIRGAAAAALARRGGAANTVSLIGNPSAIADVFRNSQIAYAPKDTGKPAFDDEIQIRVVAGLRPVVGDFCREATKADCQFESSHDAPACDTAGATTSPCVVSASVRLPIADSPSYVDARDASASSGRSLEARARTVFLFWLIATPILGFFTYRASKYFWTRAHRVGLGF